MRKYVRDKIETKKYIRCTYICVCWILSLRFSFRFLRWITPRYTALKYIGLPALVIKKSGQLNLRNYHSALGLSSDLLILPMAVSSPNPPSSLPFDINRYRCRAVA